MELTKEQKAVVEATEKHILVNSGAGSGKTKSLVYRIKYLLEQGVSEKDIVAITFTNAAAEEITERVGNVKGLFIGTIHSLANKILKKNNIDTSNLIKEENFDRFFALAAEKDLDIPKIKYLLLDEGQDSSSDQLTFIFDTLKPENWMIFYDIRQSIYRFNGAVPDNFIELRKRKDVTNYELSNNFRNGIDILDFAKSLISSAGWEYMDYTNPKSERNGAVIKVDYNGAKLADTIKAAVLGDKTSKYGDWFVLTRTNKQIQEFCTFLDARDMPYTTFKRSEIDSATFNKKMKEDNIKVLTIHTAKGLEAKNVVAIGASYSNLEEKCISYVAATRAKELLVWATKRKKKRRTRPKPNTSFWD